ncbi:SPOR domain-containing protein [Halomicronema hongdechloris]|nr:SPOR domain-containing protein [Halomicronema hongdechloris]
MTNVHPHSSGDPRQHRVAIHATGSAELNPVLGNALGSLTINLDDELSRYRRLRQGQSTARAYHPPFRKSRKALGLISVQPQAAQAPTTPTKSQGAPSVVPPPPPNPRLTRQPDPGQLTVATTTASQPSSSPSEPSLVPAIESPQDYLASSEALLRSTPSQSVPSESGSKPLLWRHLTTPLGLGTLLFLLVGSGGLGYVLTNPATLEHLWQGHPSETAADGAQRSAATSDTQTQFESWGPDLASQEFIELNLNTLSTLSSQLASPEPDLPSSAATSTEAEAEAEADPNGTTSEATTTRASASESPPSGSAAAVPTPAQPRTMSRRPAPTPQAPTPPSPRPSRSAAPSASPAASASPTPTSVPPNYYVVADYTGDQSLAAARQVVGDAYVRNFSMGARIQLGAFVDSESAQSLVRQLQSQGITAQVHTP